MATLRKLLRQYKPLLHNKNFVKVLIAGFISNIGSKISYFALLRKVYILSEGSITNLGFLTLAQMIPAILIGPFAGILVDRSSRKRIMIASDFMNGVVILSLIFANNLTYIYIVAVLKALATSFRFPAQSAMEPNLVAKDDIVLLNSFKATSNNLVQIVGSAIGGATVGFLGAQKAFAVDSATFFVSGLILATMIIAETHIATTRSQRERRSNSLISSQWKSFKEGVLVLKEDIQVKMVFLINIFLNFAMAMQGILIYYFLKQTLQLGDSAEQFWGYLLSALGVGGVVGSFLIGAIIKSSRNRFGLFLNILLFDSIVLSAFLLNKILPLSLVLFSMLGIVGAGNQIIIHSILQERTDDRKRGRVFSLMSVIIEPLGALSVLVGTVGAEFITARNVLLVAAALEALIALSMRFTSSYRKVSNEATSAHVAQTTPTGS